MTLETKDINIYNREKLGNLFLYLSKEIDDLFFTKMLKLTYLIDEISVKETGSPVTWLEYKVWKNGPVPQKIHTNITYENGDQFSDFITAQVKKVRVGGKNIQGLEISPNGTFSDDEFSDYEIELMDRVIKNYGGKSANQLIEILHETGSLWHRIVEERGLSEKFDSDVDSNTSPYSIDLKEAIDDPVLVGIYTETENNLAFIQKIEA